MAYESTKSSNGTTQAMAADRSMRPTLMALMRSTSGAGVAAAAGGRAAAGLAGTSFAFRAGRDTGRRVARAAGACHRPKHREAIARLAGGAVGPARQRRL